jgi:RsiW-degrading membrane proteinase PrsW (M82 family)
VSCAFADGLGTFAENTLIPIQILTHIFGLVGILIGSIFILTALSFWRSYKTNPVFMPLHKILWTLFFGFFCLFIGYINEPGKIISTQANYQSIKSPTSVNKNSKKHWVQEQKILKSNFLNQ